MPRKSRWSCLCCKGWRCVQVLSSIPWLWPRAPPACSGCRWAGDHEHQMCGDHGAVLPGQGCDAPQPPPQTGRCACLKLLNIEKKEYRALDWILPKVIAYCSQKMSKRDSLTILGLPRCGPFDKKVFSSLLMHF